MHQEFGSFGFSYEHPCTLFRDLRPLVVKPNPLEVEPEVDVGEAKIQIDGDVAQEDIGPIAVENGWVTDMQGFFNLFPERRLALDIFTVT